MRNNKKESGIVLLLVLATLLIVIVLANVVLTIVSSQTRLTHHQVSRIQALYANRAGINLALECLRTSNLNLCGTSWAEANLPVTTEELATKGTFTFCRDKDLNNNDCFFRDPDLPGSIIQVNIEVSCKRDLTNCVTPFGTGSSWGADIQNDTRAIRSKAFYSKG